MRKKLLLCLIALVTCMGAHAELEQDDGGYYLINDFDQLQEFSLLVRNGQYTVKGKLMADIDMAGITNYIAIGLYADNGGAQNYFAGVFDGQGHVIKNMSITREDNYEVGFFSRCNGATVKNLGFINATMESKNGIRTGVMGGEINNSTVINCFVIGDISLTTTNEQIGGFAGEAANSTTFINCYTTHDLIATKIGNEQNIINSYCGTDVEQMAPTGELCYALNGDQSTITFRQTIGTDPYPTFDVNSGQVFALGSLNCDGTPLGNVTYSNSGENVLPPHQYDENGYCVNCGAEEGVVEETASGWYEVTTPAEMRYVGRLVNKGNTAINIRLMNDIDLGEIIMHPIGAYSDADQSLRFQYKGKFDGQNHIIYNLTIYETDGQECGFFGRCQGATIQNLGIVNASITNGAPYRAGVIGGEIYQSTVTNCFTAGDIDVNTDHGQRGGIAGESASTTLNNCYTTYEFLSNGGTWNNCYWGEEANDGVETGALCYKMNGSSIQNVTWYQTLGEDLYPVLDSTHGLVYPISEEDFASATTPEEYAQLVSSLIEAEKEVYEQKIATSSLINNYIRQLNRLENADFEDFFAAYEKLNGLREAIATSEAAYSAFMASIADLSVYLDTHDDFEGEGRDVLETYLNTTVEPNETYPHGSYPYILETLKLSSADLEAELAFAQELLNQAIISGYKPGAEISAMLTNPNFVNTMDGWTFNEGRLDVITATTGPVKSIVKTPVRMDLSQTLTDLTPGLYGFCLSGYTEIVDALPEGAYNYGGFVYANDTKNYFNTQRSGLLPEEVASKYSTFALKMDADGNPAGYAPNSIQGVANAISEGYYLNQILTNVTDGTLKVGMQNFGTKGKTNTAYFGKAQLFYYGTIEEATEAIDAQLQATLEVANHVLNDYVFQDGEYAAAPNYNISLSEELASLIDKASSGGSNQEKYDLIVKFGEVFQQIYDSKAAYLELMSVNEEVWSATYDLGSEEDQMKVEAIYGEVIDMYLAGTASIEEVMSKIEELEANEYYLQTYGVEPENVIGDVYQLSTPYNLIWFAAQVNKKANLTIKGALANDIDMSVLNNFTPIGYFIDNAHGGTAEQQRPFKGVFDGQGHEIQNLRINRSDMCEVGFFGRAQGATIKNMGICNATMVNGAEVRAGVLGGEIHESTVSNCYTVGEISVEANHDQAFAFAGEAASTTLVNCYTTGDTFCGTSSTTISRCYWGEEANAGVANGKLCFDLNGDQKTIVYYQTLGQDAYPVLDATHGQVYCGGELYCDGTPKADYIYSNTEMTPNRDPHEFDEEGICTICGGDIGEVLASEDGWYEITTPYQLRWLSKFVNASDNDNSYANVRLMNDIDMTGINLKPIGYYTDDSSQGFESHEYRGTFDGQGHEIHNLLVDIDDRYEAGLFGRATNATIKNLGVVNATVRNTFADGRRLGVIAGELNTCTVTNVYSTGEIVLESAHVQRGGLAGEASKANMTNCWTSYRSFSSLGNKTNCYYGDAVTSTMATGELCYKLNNGVVTDPVWRQTLGEDGYPVLDATHKIVYEDEDGTYTNELTQLAQYAGTEEDPILIKTPKDLVMLRSYMITGQVTYVRLENDLDMSAYESFTPLNTYEDAVGDLHFMNWINFDGNGHVISNFSSVTSGVAYNSLFGVLCGAVYNLGLENANVVCDASGTGILSGYVGHENFSETTRVEHVYVTGKIDVASNYCGGLFGNVGGPTIIRNCYANTTISGSATYNGGLIGSVRGALNMQNCYAAGENTLGGGIVGGNQAASTPASTYNNIVVWNNDYENFGTTASADQKSNISYYNGENFSELQQTVVAWDPTIWSFEGDNYPVLIGKSDMTALRSIAQPATGNITVYSMTGTKMKVAPTMKEALQGLTKGIYIVGGKKMLVK